MKEAVRRTIASAWAFRTRVEHEAAARFDRLAKSIRGFDSISPVVQLMERAAADERRHAKLCADIAAAFGQPAEGANEAWPAIAPAALGARKGVLYEVVASCCITETESVATVTTLLAERPEPSVRAALHQIATDEVGHGRMGWAHLAREASFLDVRFLAGWIPAMLSGTVDDRLFAEQRTDPDADELLRHGVLPASRKRELFVGTLEEVVLPGLEQFGIDTAPARSWLSDRRAGLARKATTTYENTST